MRGSDYHSSGVTPGPYQWAEGEAPDDTVGMQASLPFIYVDRPVISRDYITMAVFPVPVALLPEQDFDDVDREIVASNRESGEYDGVPGVRIPWSENDNARWVCAAMNLCMGMDVEEMEQVAAWGGGLKLLRTMQRLQGDTDWPAGGIETKE